MALTNEERISVSKENVSNGKWVKISIQKVHTLLEMEDNDDRKSFLDYLCIDLNYVEEQRNNLMSKHGNLVQELNTCKERLLVLKQAKLDLLTMQHVNTEILDIQEKDKNEANPDKTEHGNEKSAKNRSQSHNHLKWAGDDESLPDEDVPKENFKIYSNPLFEIDEEIISSEIDPLYNKEIDIFLASDDSVPLGIESDDYDSEGDVLFLKELLNNNSIPPPEYESFHVDLYNVPSSRRPPKKPPDDIESHPRNLTTIVVGDIFHVPNVLPTLYLDSDFPLLMIPSDPILFLSLDEFPHISFIRDPLSPVFDTLLLFSSENEDKVFTPGILASKEEKSPCLLSHRGFKAFKIVNDLSKSPMMISGEDIPILDVPFLHFYPL
ncbi:hypothetical protein Tco_1045670 [Tanacetum coccineum]|uniref:Reverse transcriptase domain-containing protein n=1 Tax=Tanacetum coccineum TaxID=301880 RepID=A0ABQ5GV12_9ASTR